MTPVLVVVVLVCNLTIGPAACSERTARSVTVLKAQGETACMMVAQTTIAGTEVKPGPGEYMKTICKRRRG